MSKLIHIIALAAGLVFSAGATAQNLSKSDYQAGKNWIAVEYRSALAGCASLSGNANAICAAEANAKDIWVTEAKGAQTAAKADAKARLVQ